MEESPGRVLFEMSQILSEKAKSLSSRSVSGEDADGMD
jgi:hypothetical protein